MSTPWPPGFRRIPQEPWVRRPLDELARGYDTVEHHGWYRNLEPTLATLSGRIEDGRIVMDYSGGTGILAQKLLERLPGCSFGVLIVDSSPKFLRLAVEKLGASERVAFRLIRYLKEEKRLQLIDEVIEPVLRERRVDILVSTNAIHLYYELPRTLSSWRQILADDGWLHVQSGNIRNPDAPEGEWIIDETVEAIHAAGMEIVRREDRFSAFRPVLDDPGRMRLHDALRRKYFLPVRPLDYYETALRDAGFSHIEASRVTIDARVNEWRDFLSVYHDGVLGWAGGTRKIEGRQPAPEVIDARLALLAAAMEQVFAGRETFAASWTYLDARP
ncbi:MAG: class I SAM-dependent methyltransferase [Acidobacteriota bacterium]